MVFGIGKVNCGHYLKDQLKALNHEQDQFQAEISALEDLDVDSFIEHLHAGNFDRFGEILTAMYVTSTKTEATLDHIHGACMAAQEVTITSKQRKAIDRIIKKVLDAEKENMAYGERLPLTLGKGGWRTGSETFAKQVRMIVNIPGYLLIEGASRILGPEKKRVLYEMYNRSRLDFQKALDEYNQSIRRGEPEKKQRELKEGVRKAIKDFRHYMRICRVVGRAYRRLRKDVLKIVKKEGIDSIEINTEDIERFATSDHVRGAKAYARTGYGA